MSAALPRLARAEAFRVRVPFRRPFVTARGPLTHRTSWIVRLRDEAGVEGFGEAALHPAASAVEEAELDRLVRAALTALAAGGLVDAGDLGPSSNPRRAQRAGIDAALAELEAARRAGGDVAGDVAENDVAGASRSIAVQATIDSGPPAAAARDAVRAVAAGFSTLKLKVGSEPDARRFVDQVRAVRGAVGPAIRLRLDVNGVWDRAMARERLEAIADLDIEYVEQPLPSRDLAGHAALRQACPVPVALDESIASGRAARAVLDAGAADVLVLKPARVGGPRAVAAIAADAAAAGVPVVLSTFFETGIGIAAALRAAADLPASSPERAHGLATAAILEHDLLTASIPVAAGRMTVPHRLFVDDEALRHYALETVEWNP